MNNLGGQFKHGAAGRQGWNRPSSNLEQGQREAFFGPPDSTRWNQQRLHRTLSRFTHHELDIRDRAETCVDQARRGDQICYYSDLRKIRRHYPNWQPTRTLPQIVEELAAAWRERLAPR